MVCDFTVIMLLEGGHKLLPHMYKESGVSGSPCARV